MSAVRKERRVALRAAIVRWFRRNHRDLPWRRTRDPYAIWAAEVMLQQTRIETALPYFQRWMRRFPTVRSLADASLEDVFGLWQGLGYYARARHFHAAARLVVSRHGGRVPRDRRARLALPGIGRYTAGAIGSIAFGLPEPVLDGNVERVFCRIEALRADPRQAAVRERLWDLATELVRGVAPGRLNEALMELGARVCVPGAPRCGECPVVRHCKARRQGLEEDLPPRRRRRAPPLVHGVAARIVRGKRWLVVRRPPGGLLGGLWELPGDEGRGKRALARSLREAFGTEVRVGARLATVTHAFTHRRLRLVVYAATLRGTPRRRRYAEHRWVTPLGLARMPLSTLHRRVLAAST